MRLRGILLDLDGTLIDHEGAVRAALRGWLPALGVPATEEVIALWFAALERHLAAWRAREISFAEQRRRRLRDFLPQVGVAFVDDDEHLDAVFDTYLPCYERGWQVYDDVADGLALIAAAGLPTAVLTNGDPAQQAAKLASAGLTELVGPVFTPAMLGAAKPDAGAFLGACERLGLPPEAVANIGDRHDLDVLGARAAGLRAIFLDRLGTGPEDDMRIASLRDLAAVL